MIAMLAGLVARVDLDSCVIDVGGVGYLVFASSRTLSQLPPQGEAVTLEIETQVREDHIHLFGFRDAQEKTWFNLITTVQGVGAKVALAILGVLPPAELAQALAGGDKTMITRAPGVGPKLAQRMISELKDKVGRLQPTQDSVTTLPQTADTGLSQDLVSALVNLGYGKAQAAAVITGLVAQNPEGDFESLFRAAISELAS